VKAILFDFDGVLTTDKTGSLTTLRYLSAQTGISHEKLDSAFKKFNGDLNLGKVTHEEIWPALCDSLGNAIDLSLLPRAFESTPINAGMFELALRLKAAYSVAIITDNKKDRIDHLKLHLGLPELFDPILVSAEVGCLKSEVGIFREALRCLQVEANDCVFIDNSEGNLRVAESLGMNVVYFDDEANDIEALVRTLTEQYGVDVPVEPYPSMQRTSLSWLRQAKAAAHVER
jgi:putative hydrolase of the HAD superfamily